MKSFNSRSAFLFAALGVAITFSSPLFGGDDLLNQCETLVHQAWNPDGDAPSVAQRTDLLKQALKLAKASPSKSRVLRGDRLKTTQDIEAALSELERGDPDNKATGYIHDADLDLRSAISDAG